MHRQPLIAALEKHSPWDEQEADMLLELLNFVRTVPECFEKTNVAGHITASSWIVSPDSDLALMVLHSKLGLWLQPGGHAEGQADVQEVAHREAWEETGLNVKLILPEIFDVDIHRIPAHKEVASHLHYDIRYLYGGDPDEKLVISAESRELEWVPMAEIKNRNSDRSIMRLLEKLRK